MELWFIYTLLSAIAAGLFTFGLKVIAEKQLDANVLSAIYLFVMAVFCAVTWLATGAVTVELSFGLLMGALSGVVISSLYVIQVQGLRYIDTALFFPIYKTLSPLFVIVAGVIYIGEAISQMEYVALALSLAIPLLLIDRQEKHRQTDLWRGVGVLVLCSLLAMVVAILAKVALDAGVSVFLFLAVQALAGLLTNFVWGWWQGKPIVVSKITGQYLQYGAVLGLLMFAFSALALEAFRIGLVSVVYTVQSLYILIPIVLSVWIYSEHMNLRKAIAIVLSLVAIVLFQV